MPEKYILGVVRCVLGNVELEKILGHHFKRVMLRRLVRLDLGLVSNTEKLASLIEIQESKHCKLLTKKTIAHM